MIPDGSKSSDRERRLDDALAEYLEAEEAGRPPEREAFLARHSGLATELRQFFENRSGLRSAVRPSPTKVHEQQTQVLPAAAPTANVPSAQPAPDRFGDYELLGEIARGGMGVVYRARQVSIGREVALKMILANQQSAASALRRFWIEAEAAATLDHPNIVPIYDVGEINGQPFFTMKLVAGGSLDARLKEISLGDPATGKPFRLSSSERRRRQEASASLLAAVARAVHHAHRHGILHRDLKPGNILLQQSAVRGQQSEVSGPIPEVGSQGAKGRNQRAKGGSAGKTQASDLRLLTSDFCPMITDFGLAKRTEVDEHVTQSQMIVGTAAYMAPEQASATKGGVTTAVDVYSLGTIFYELLTGQKPFTGPTMFDILVRVVQEAPVPPRQLNGQVDADLELVCLKCLEKEPERRYQSALELAEDLERWQKGEVVSLRKPGRGERMRRWVRRNRLAAVLMGAVAILMTVVTLGSAFAAWHIGLARDAADHNAGIAENNAIEANQARDAADRNAADANKAREAAVIARTVAEKALADREKTLAENQRLLVTGYVANGTRALDSGDVYTALAFYGVALRTDASDPRLEEPHRVRLATAFQRCPRLVQVWFDRTDQPDLSPDGERVAHVDRGTVRLWRIDRDEAEPHPLNHPVAVKRVRFSPDGNRLLTLTSDGQVYLWDLKAANPTSRVIKHAKAIVFASFDRDGSRLVTVGGDDQEARVWSTATGNLQSGPYRQTTPALFASFSKDGRYLATCGGKPNEHGEVHVWDLQRDNSAKHFSATVAYLLRLAHLSPDGRSVVAVGGRSLAKTWDVSSGRELAAISNVRGAWEGVISPDAARVLKLDGGTVWMCDSGTGQHVGLPLRHGADVYHASFSPDGRFIVTAARELAVRVWDAASGQPVTPPLRQGRAIKVGGAWFSADGRRLMTATDDAVRIWELMPHESTQLAARPSEAKLSALSPTGDLLATIDRDGSIQVRDAGTGKTVAGPWKLPEVGTHLAFTPDGDHLAAASKVSLRVWNVRTGVAATPVLAHTGGLQQLVRTTDGTRLAMRMGFEIKICDATTGKDQPLKPLDLKPQWRDLGWTTAGPTGITVRGGTIVEIRDPLTGAVHAGPFRHASAVTHVALSSNGKVLAVSTSEGNAYLWDVASGHPATPTLKYGSTVQQVVFSSDGRRLATVADDHSVRVWDTSTGLSLSPIWSSADPIDALALNADGQRLTVRYRSGTGRAWALAPDRRPVKDLIQLAEWLSGEMLDLKSGGLELLSPPLGTVWPRMRAQFPAEFHPSRP